MNVSLGALERIDARGVFTNEDRQFTPWPPGMGRQAAELLQTLMVNRWPKAKEAL